MTTHVELTSHIPAVTDRSPWQRLLALSGVAFAPLFVVGWLSSAVSDSPNYIAAEQKWIKWAHSDHIKGRVSSFALLLAAFAFIYFLGALRSALEEAESSVRGSRELARVAFAGALTGIVGITMAFVSIANASAPGANADPLVSKAVTTSAAGPFLVGATGFSAFLLATGVLTLRTGVLSRWTGFLALIGSSCFSITLLTILNNSGNGSAFGYAFFPAMLSLVIWTVSASISRYRATGLQHQPDDWGGGDNIASPHRSCLGESGLRIERRLRALPPGFSRAAVVRKVNDRHQLESWW